jgi:hypothetical protein
MLWQGNGTTWVPARQPVRYIGEINVFATGSIESYGAVAVKETSFRCVLANGPLLLHRQLFVAATPSRGSAQHRGGEASACPRRRSDAPELGEANAPRRRRAARRAGAGRDPGRSGERLAAVRDRRRHGLPVDAGRRSRLRGGRIFLTPATGRVTMGLSHERTRHERVAPNGLRDHTLSSPPIQATG